MWSARYRILIPSYTMYSLILDSEVYELRCKIGRLAEIPGDV